MKYVGFIGWRGLVGSVLIQRMQEENDFKYIRPVFFSSSQNGRYKTIINNKLNFIYHAFNLEILIELDIIVSCQGNSYTKIIHNRLRKLNWQGYWIDSASILRMHQNSCIVLEPVNRSIVKKKIFQGYKDFIGSNCSVSLMLIALGGLFEKKLIEWVSVATYQAATGAGSNYTRKLLLQINKIHSLLGNKLNNPAFDILKIENKIHKLIKNKNIFQNSILAYNIMPWIGKKIKFQQSLEEKKYQEEVFKILNLNHVIPIDGTCVRVGSLRCHSQSFTIKLKKNVSILEIEQILSNHNAWVKIIPDDPEKIINDLTPVSVSGSLYIAIGRIRKLSIGNKYLSIFTVGDQLLWGAAEPLRCVLNQLII
ncbi:NAD(P)-binding aspartate-semialdehyde dehydrogenase [Wigglesworthia glossinidia endosymbiont of Glossina morsitans morsitans (Yale colony)]|uniref:Aspartate-semialdehyde dehydrogenase n=1 Tax=Wigglesworthia glossinidia endosymbiont of Glossina morsitans morsitans (Yale colony) TaxID=1142511 RepID=H6Q5V8_WIGGL|nr:aspartate-semialdehyde dehydrogenase [Wigglesworthia glossinidia]AFA41154.1 NAD(P)-binding aspartate-semialdehyde dehydrogenase [Wigglesworthia glossinidia endosymbiont of Glossina morsitans morsitans (Yale colony)]